MRITSSRSRRAPAARRAGAARRSRPRSAASAPSRAAIVGRCFATRSGRRDEDRDPREAELQPCAAAAPSRCRRCRPGRSARRSLSASRAAPRWNGRLRQGSDVPCGKIPSTSPSREQPDRRADRASVARRRARPGTCRTRSIRRATTGSARARPSPCSGSAAVVATPRMPRVDQRLVVRDEDARRRARGCARRPRPRSGTARRSSSRKPTRRARCSGSRALRASVASAAASRERRARAEGRLAEREVEVPRPLEAPVVAEPRALPRIRSWKRCASGGASRRSAGPISSTRAPRRDEPGHRPCVSAPSDGIRQPGKT